MYKRYLMLSLSVILMLGACSSEKTLEQALEDREVIYREEALRYVIDEYSFSEIAEEYYYRNPEECEEPSGRESVDMGLICDEMDSQGYSKDYAYFFEIAEKIGYWPSAIVGEYCKDKSTQIIHETDSLCVEEMAYENMCFVFRESKDMLTKEMNDDDEFLNDCILCEVCILK